MNINNDKLIKEINDITKKYNEACDELTNLVKKDYPVPVLKERYFFIMSNITRNFDELMENQIQLNKNKNSL